MPWEPPALTTLLQNSTFSITVTSILTPALSLFALWWLFAGSAPFRLQTLCIVFVCAIGILFAVPQDLLWQLYGAVVDWLLAAQIHDFLIRRYRMVLFLSAAVWLIWRAGSTLLTPVPDLISVLGVDVPDVPDVSLAKIRADQATISWSRPSSSKPVQKYVLYVNGIEVSGETAGTDLAITVTGLKPNNFYNLRVVAVGPNNYRTGSAVVRLRTFGQDGKPQLGNSRVPTSFAPQDEAPPAASNEANDVDLSRRFVPHVEPAPSFDSNVPPFRDSVSSNPMQRRNTLNRKHSPSINSTEQPRPNFPGSPDLTLAELTTRFELIRREMEETLSLYAKDDAESRGQEEELKKEKDRKRQLLRDREEQTTQLRTMVRATMEQMRASEKERTKREQQLKEKENKKVKVRDNVSKLEHEVARMEKELKGFEAQKAEVSQRRNCAVQKLDDGNDELQKKCTELEAELKDKGKQLQDLKEAREQLPGADDAQWREGDMMVRRDWDMKRKDLHNSLVSETKRLHQLDQHIRVLEQQISIQSQSSLAFFGHADSPPVDYETLATAQSSKRLSHNSTSIPGSNLSPPQVFGATDLGYSSNPIYGQTGFYTPIGAQPKGSGDLTEAEAEIRAQSGPMSPSIAGLLPSFLLPSHDEAENQDEYDSDLPEGNAAYEDDPQSPASSKHSFQPVMSPRASTHSLAFSHYHDQGDGSSLNINSSPRVPEAGGTRLSHLLQSFQRSRGPKAGDDGARNSIYGPPIGTLKTGQSQSFPRGTEDGEMANKRRLSFSWMSRPTAEDSLDPASPSSRHFTGRRFNIFGHSAGTPFGDRDDNNSRPVSIASTELPRPSTDSSSIWGPADHSGLAKHRMWPSNEPRWASRNGSRRPSLHGSPAALTTTLASADDEILDERDLLNPQSSPSQVGVIGSRPPASSRAINRNLNPGAPMFINSFFRKSRDTDREPSPGEVDKGKGKEKVKDGKANGKETAPPSIELSSPIVDDSPSDPRLSRDTFSVHTQASTTESHDSLPLDLSVSHTASDLNAGSLSSAKDTDNAMRKLFRKGSSSKFSFTSRLGKDSSLFKKGPSSTTNSEKAISADHRSSVGDLDEFGEEAAPAGRDSATSSPSLAPIKPRDAKESRISSWRFSVKKKGKDGASRDKESLDLERSADDE